MSPPVPEGTKIAEITGDPLAIGARPRPDPDRTPTGPRPDPDRTPTGPRPDPDRTPTPMRNSYWSLGAPAPAKRRA
jgi:hypothetical protein